MSSYKNFQPNEIVNTKTLLHEAIPITSSIISGTYSGNNIKKFSNDLYSTVYDYPYASSSANPLFDLTVGYNTASAASGAASSVNAVASKKKLNIYSQMAKVLIGHNSDGDILSFDEDGNFNDTSARLMNSMFFMNFSRVLVKDEIKKGSFNLQLGVSTSSASPFNAILTITDTGSLTSYGVNSPVGDYGILYASSVTSGTINSTSSCGIIFYQAGVAAISTNVFAISSSNSPTSGLTSNLSASQRGILSFTSAPQLSGTNNVANVLVSGNIEDFNYGVRRRIRNVQFNNTTELNSTIYFCKIPSSEFNYSSNETYLSESKIIVKSRAAQDPISYFTTVGLYSARNELLAVAKLSEPIRKDPSTELTLRVRLDY